MCKQEDRQPKVNPKAFIYLPKIVNEYDQDIPQSRTTEKPVALQVHLYYFKTTVKVC